MKTFLKKHPIISGIVLSIAGLFIAVKIFWYVYDTIFYRGIIPPQIETSGRYFISTKPDYFMGGCGIAAFTLSEETIDRIKTEGIAFFSTARTGVKKWLFQPSVPKEYKVWKETPDQGAVHNGLGPGFGCVKEPKKGWYSQVLAAIRKPGSFYTRGYHGGMIFVIPDMNVVIFSFFD